MIFPNAATSDQRIPAKTPEHLERSSWSLRVTIVKQTLIEHLGQRDDSDYFERAVEIAQHALRRVRRRQEVSVMIKQFAEALMSAEADPICGPGYRDAAPGG
jgi:hypothetical protein